MWCIYLLHKCIYKPSLTFLCSNRSVKKTRHELDMPYIEYLIDRQLDLQNDKPKTEVKQKICWDGGLVEVEKGD